MPVFPGAVLLPTTSCEDTVAALFATKASLSIITLPLLNVDNVRSDELKASPVCIYKEADDFIYEAVGFVNTRSYAIDTSPGLLNEVGRFEVIAVSDTENREDPLSRILNIFPNVVPFAPMFKDNKSPVAIVAEPGLQSRFKREPIPAVPLREVAVVERFKSVPVVNVLPVVERLTSFPDVIDEELI